MRKRTAGNDALLFRDVELPGDPPMKPAALRPDVPLFVAAALLMAGAWRTGGSPRVIHLVANEYAFIAPETTPAGLTTFTLENRGLKFHEVLVGLLRPGASGADIIATHKQGIGFRQLGQFYLEGDPSGALFASPGKTSAGSLTLDLQRGRSYVLVCQLRDSTGAVQHAMLGMFRILRVE
jgi:hypothetical protein